jgi:hypothetical protein
MAFGEPDCACTYTFSKSLLDTLASVAAGTYRSYVYKETVEVDTAVPEA